ncbi:MAG: signal peptidase II [Acidimicrobiales bacterium]|tara:strand:+ start:479 stop:994 length:516 start_codon:yes stop_codon:yes gene_type:complete
MFQPWKSSIITSSGIILLDQLTKWWALERLEDGQIVELFWTLQFRLVRNTGIAFSQGENLGPVFTILILFVILLVVRLGAQIQSRVGKVSVGLVIGGAIGNLVDRVFRAEEGFLGGGVVDFVDFQWWPVFNIADSAIVVGGLMMFWAGMKSTEYSAENTDSDRMGTDSYEQ